MTILGNMRSLSLTALVALAAAVSGPARAEDPPQAPAPVASTGVTGPACVLRGTYPGTKGAQIYDAASGGRALASFTGAILGMSLSDFPADPTTGRARIATSLGTGAVRIDGWIAPSQVPVFTARDVPVAAGHVWIADAQRVRLVQGQPGTLTVELTVPGSNGQVVRASTGCDALALQQGQPTAMPVPGNGHGYMTKGTSVDLYDAPDGSAVFTLKLLENASQLYWSTESRGSFVHLRGRGSLVVDAWAKLRELEPLKKGEMMDQFIPPTTQVSGAQLSLDRQPKLVTATAPIVVRSHRDDKEKPIGVIEAGAEIYLMETMTGWTNVLPRNLSLMPPDDAGFWIPSSEAPK